MTRRLFFVSCAAVLFLSFFFSMFSIPAAAAEDSVEEDDFSSENEVFSESFALLDEQTKALLREVGVDPADLTSLLRLSPASFWRLFRSVFAITSSGLRQSFLGALILLVASGLLMPLCPSRMRETTGHAVTLLSVFSMAAGAVGAADSVLSSVRLTGTLARLLLPVPLAAAALSGRPLTAAVVQNGLFYFSEAADFLFSQGLAPLIGIVLALSAAGALAPDETLPRFVRGLTRILTLVSGSAAGIFALVLRMQGALSGSGDAVALGSAKILVGSTVPVVGSALADTLAGVASSISLAGGSVAMLGILLICVLLLPALAVVLTVKFCLWAAELFCTALDLSKAGDFASALSPAFTLFGAIALFHAAVLALSLGMLLKPGII